MIKSFSFLLLLTVFFSCNFPTEFPILEKAKSADNFARTFIDNIVSGQTEKAFADIDSEVLDDKVKKFITNSSRNINGAALKKYRVVEANWVSGVFTDTRSPKFTRYRLGYEYEFEKGRILFTTTIKELDGKFSVIAFNGEFLPAPLSELTKFTFTNKYVIHYIFLVLCCLVPLFILTTFIVMLFTKMTTKKKVIWGLIILLISSPQFLINWGNGRLDFNLLHISILGGGFSKPTLYSAWILSFGIPIGAIIFWFKRPSLQLEIIQEDDQQVNGDISDSDDTTSDGEKNVS